MGNIEIEQPGTVTGGAPQTSSGRMPGVRHVGFDAPLRWLARGWGDFRATGFRGAVYGAIFALMGTLIALVYATKWQLTMGLCGCCTG